MRTLRGRAFTRIDLAILIATVGMIAVWVLYVAPRMWARPRRSNRINCTSQLKQVALGFRMWSNDHGDQFPWQVPVADGGTKEFANLPSPEIHFIAVSNELNSSKILTCSKDTKRARTNSWQGFTRANLSYFVGHDADEAKPNTILSGDRNVSTNSSILAGILTVQDAGKLRWQSTSISAPGTLDWRTDRCRS
jgi:hypothetical protein